MNKYQKMGIALVLADLADSLLSLYIFHIEPQYGICAGLGLVCFAAGTALSIRNKRRGSRGEAD